jgi:hypothetical protein
VLGEWYATVLAGRPMVALFVSETTLLPVLVPWAPAKTLIDRFPAALATVLRAHDVDPAFIDTEVQATTSHAVGATNNRSLVGMLTEFSFLAAEFRQDEPVPDLLALSLRLATVPCGPLYKRHVSPDRELRALVARTPRP